MKKILFIALPVLFLSLLPMSGTAISADNVKEGNKLYKEKQYDKAIEEYSKAKEEETAPDIVSFNTGTALYRQEKYEEAINAFTNALITEDKRLEAKGNYNIANSKFRLGSQEINKDISEAIHIYKQSLNHYKRAIELDEANDDARYNHELVEKRMKVLLDKLKNQQEQEKEQEGEEGEEQEETEGQQSGDAAEEHGEEELETESDQVEADKQEEAAGDETASQEDKAGSDESTDAEEEEGEEMTPEEANMLLEAFGEEESLDTLEKRGRAQFRGVLKNW
jgi:Ca-activated chloride channel family protein